MSVSQFGPAYNFLGAVTRQPADWLDATARSPIAQNDLDPCVSRFVMMKHLNTTWEGCVEARHSTAGSPYDVNNAPPNAADPATLFVPAFASDEPDGSGGYPNSYLADGAPLYRKRHAAAAHAKVWGGLCAAASSRFPSAAKQQFGPVAAGADGITDNQTFYGGYPVPKGQISAATCSRCCRLTANLNAVRAKVNCKVGARLHQHCRRRGLGLEDPVRASAIHRGTARKQRGNTGKYWCF